MLNSIKAWVDNVDWNGIVQICIDYSYFLYYTPFPFLLIGSYFLLKSAGSKYKLINALVSVLITIGLLAFNHTQNAVIKGLDFNAIELVAKETVLSAGLGVLAIVIFSIRGVYGGIKNFKQKEKSVA